MRAGPVHIQIPISQISCHPFFGDVSDLKESISRYGLLQPVGIIRKNEHYKLVFGARRLEACRQLGQKYIHAVIICARENELKAIAASENIHRKALRLSELAAIANVCSPQELTLSLKDISLIRSFCSLGQHAQQIADRLPKELVEKACGDDTYLLRMYAHFLQLPEASKNKMRISVLSDKRIFINEIENIVSLMKKGGYTDSINEDDEKIIINKHAV